MKILDFGRYALSTCAVAAVLAGCGGSRPPIVEPGALGFSQLASRAKYIYFARETSIQAYPSTANGNLASTTWIAGNKTLIDHARAIYVAPSGALFTCNSDGRILGFRANARGNAPPSRNIGGNYNPLKACRSLAVYAGRVDAIGLEPRDSVVGWGKNSNGNVGPATTISGEETQLKSPANVAFDDSGNIYVANLRDAITVYAPSANGDVPPLRRIAGSKTGLSFPVALGIDRVRKLIYVANADSKAITAYKLSQSGDVDPTIAISGNKTGLNRPYGVAVDAAGYVYATNNPSAGPRFLTVYEPGSNGNVAPVQTIKGAKVDLSLQIAVR